MKHLTIIFIFMFTAVLSLSGDERTFSQIAKDPVKVMDYFLTCPYFDYQQTTSAHKYSGSVMKANNGFAKPMDYPEGNFISRKLVLQGISRDYRHSVKSLTVDPVQGYIHIALEYDDLTMTYFERADKSRVVGLSLSDLSGQFSSTQWAFFDVSGGKWKLLPNDQILPANWLSIVYTGDSSQKSKDFLSLTSWDINFPQTGTIVHLRPEMFESDLDSAQTKITVPGTDRQILLGEYNNWYNKQLQDKSMELIWNTKTGRFDAGKIVKFTPETSKGVPGRGIDQVLKNPQNVWEYFLADPEIQVNAKDGISVSYEDRDADTETRTGLLAQKQALLDGGLGNMELNDIQSGNPLVIDIPNGYLNFNLAQPSADNESGSSGIEKTTSFTLVYFEKTDKSRIVAYRIWGVSPKYNGPVTEYNQIAANFYLMKGGVKTILEPETLIPLNKINSFILTDGNEKDQAIQEAIVWDIQFPQVGTTIHMFPWQLEDQTPEKMKRLAALYGSKKQIEKAFQDFKDRWYNEKALALNWNMKTGKFDAPTIVKWQYMPWK